MAVRAASPDRHKTKPPCPLAPEGSLVPREMLLCVLFFLFFGGGGGKGVKGSLYSVVANMSKRSITLCRSHGKAICVQKNEGAIRSHQGPAKTKCQGPLSKRACRKGPCWTYTADSLRYLVKFCGGGQRFPKWKRCQKCQVRQAALVTLALNMF